MGNKINLSKKAAIFCIGTTLILNPLQTLAENIDLNTAKENKTGLESSCKKAFHTSFFDVYLNENVDLGEINKRMAVGFKSDLPKIDNLEEMLGYKMDRLMQRVERILDTRKDELRINVTILDDRNAIGQLYEKITKEKNAPLAFYCEKDNTIYISQKEISQYIFAHELSHALLKNCYPTLSKEIAEILSIYVDKHLEDYP